MQLANDHDPGSGSEQYMCLGQPRVELEGCLSECSVHLHLRAVARTVIGAAEHGLPGYTPEHVSHQLGALNALDVVLHALQPDCAERNRGSCGAISRMWQVLGTAAAPLNMNGFDASGNAEPLVGAPVIEPADDSERKTGLYL